MFDVIVVGGGPAGMTAALNCLRGGKKVLIIERENFGGQIASSPRVENFPTIQSISGLELTNKILEQIMALGVDFEMENVLSIEKKDNIFFVKTDYQVHEAQSVIIATGVKHRHLNVEGEHTLKGVSYCAVCDGAFYQGQDVVVIGDANTALQYTLLLSNYVKKVYLCTLFDRFFSDYVLCERVKEKDNIEIIHNLNCIKIAGKEKVEKVVFNNTIDNSTVEIPCAAVFIAIGQIPDNEYLLPLVELNKGYIVVDQKMETKTKGLFAIGDCIDKTVRQVGTAIGDGTTVAFHVLNYLQNV